MKKLMRYARKRQKGFTLIELVVVIAILGVMAAIAVPMVNNFLTSSKEQAYIADRETIQAAVSGYYSSPGNVRYLGRRQYPIASFIAADVTPGDPTQADSGSDANTDLTIEWNPLGGSQGGSPKWLDNPNDINGVRDTDENKLNDEDGSTLKGWHVIEDVERSSLLYIVDSRDYFIDFTLLVSAGLLEKVPGSASSDNDGSSTTGSYSWFVDGNGRVQSLLFFYPVSTSIDYQEVYP